MKSEWVRCPHCVGERFCSLVCCGKPTSNGDFQIGVCKTCQGLGGWWMGDQPGAPIILYPEWDEQGGEKKSGVKPPKK